jgi:CRP-like cAMP-binding protein
MHWATQTVTTVGYGDVGANTVQEILLSFVWMLVGVAFYSFIIGNFSSIITSNTALQQSVQFRVAGLAELSRKAKIPYSVTKKIKTFIENNFKSLFNQDDEA